MVKSFGRGRGCDRFASDGFRALVVMATESSYGAIIWKTVSPLFLGCFYSMLFILASNEVKCDPVVPSPGTRRDPTDQIKVLKK